MPDDIGQMTEDGGRSSVLQGFGAPVDELNLQADFQTANPR